MLSSLWGAFFIGEANRFPNATRGSFVESPSRKCLQYTREWSLSWPSTIPSARSHPDLLLWSFGKRQKEALGSCDGLLPHTIQKSPGIVDSYSEFSSISLTLRPIRTFRTPLPSVRLTLSRLTRKHKANCTIQAHASIQRIDRPFLLSFLYTKWRQMYRRMLRHQHFSHSLVIAFIA